MRFDDRVTGNLKTYALQREEDPRRHRSAPRSTRTSRVDVALVGDLRDDARRVAAARHAGRPRGVARAHRRAQGRRGGPRHPEPARRRASVRRARDQRPLAHHRGQRARRHRRRPAPDVGGAVLQARRAAHAHHLGRPRHDGLRAAGGDRREVRAPRRRGLGRRRRRRLPDDAAPSSRRSRRRSSRSTSPSSTTASSAWCASGRSSSTSERYAATPISGPDFVEARRGARPRGRDASRKRARRRATPCEARARSRRHGAHRLPVEQEDRSTRWCRPAPICTT